MKCDECGRELGDEDGFCPGCGLRIERGEAGVGAEAGADEKEESPAEGEPEKASGFAIASLILGICGFTCLPLLGSLLAVIFGIVAKSEIKRRRPEVGGSGMATAGIVMGAIVLGLMVISLAVFIPMTVVNIGPTRTVEKNIPAAGAKTASVSLEMSRGMMRVEGTAPQLLSGTITYNIKNWNPRSENSISGGERDVRLYQESGWFPLLWWTRNDWNMRLTDDIPITLKCTAGAGDVTVQGETMDLQGLTVNSSTGDVRADLAGKKPRLDNVSIENTTGNVDVIMDGSYSSPMRLRVSNTAGDVNLNLAGTWRSDLEGTVTVSAGTITVKVPSDVGVYVKASASAGSVNAPGFERTDGDVFKNPAYTKRPKAVLKLSIRNTGGSINLSEA